MITIFLLITGAAAQEVPTPASLLGPQDFNYHPYQVQFLRESKIQPTKKGPVLFPVSPPSPKTPLIVTSRPLIESILRSDLNPTNTSNQQDNIQYPNEIFNQVNKVPEAFNNIEYQATSYTGVPYNLKSAGLGAYGNDYNDYEESKAILPPIYKALSDHAQQNLINVQNKKNYNNYQPKNLDYSYENDNKGNRDYDDEKKNYAFSYTVRDHKTGDDFSHSQQSSGSATNGEYRVRLPDGRIQIVSYTADDQGYNAKVRYEDENKDYYNINSNNFNNVNNKPTNININRNDKTIPVKEEQYNSNEYYDYSAEYNNNYQPYRSKFNFQPTIAPTLQHDSTYTKAPTFVPTVRPIYENNLYTKAPSYKQTFTPTVQPTYAVLKDIYTIAPIYKPTFAPTVRPSYEEIKDLFTKSPNLYLNDLTASNSQIQGSTTEAVVLIGNKNNFNNLKSNNPIVKPIVQNSFVASTPASYLASTIASLRDRIASKSILSDSFMDRINKYLKFK